MKKENHVERTEKMKKIWKKIKRKGTKTRKIGKKFTLNNVTLTRKYGIVFTAMLLLFFISTSFVYISLKTVQNDLKELERSAERSVLLMSMAQLFEERYAILVEYLFLPTPELEAAYTDNSENFAQMMETIEPYLDTEEMHNIFDIIVKNNEDYDFLFDGLSQEAAGDFEKLSYLKTIQSRAETFKDQTFYALGFLRNMIDERRTEAVEETNGSLALSSTSLIASFVISVSLAATFLILIHRSIKGRLSSIISFSKKLTDGQLQVEDIHDSGKDELALISTTLNEMKHRLSTMMGKIAEASQEVGEKSVFLSSFSEQLKEDSSNVYSNMQNLMAGMEEQSSTFMNISDSVKNFSLQLDTINDSGQEMNGSAAHIQDLTQRGKDQMGKSILQIEELKSTVNESNEKLKLLHDRTNEISHFVRVIKDIAGQTNLLALNASIEAARAGQYGRGFAVVADEIRKLSEEVEMSVKQITELVESVNKETDGVRVSLERGSNEVNNSVSLIHESGSYFNDIHDNIVDMTAKVKGNAEAVNEMAANSQVIQTAIEETAVTSEDAVENVEGVTKTLDGQQQQVEELAQRIQELMETTERLNEFIRQYDR